MRTANLLLRLILLEALLASFGLVILQVGGTGRDEARRANPRLACRLRLSDLAFFEGPSYSRHPSLSDRFAPFADHPAAPEHSPAGSLIPPPPRLRSPS